MLLSDVCFVLHVRCDPFVPLFLLSFVLILLYKIGGQFNERLLLWQPSGIFSCYYSCLFYVVLENKIWWWWYPQSPVCWVELFKVVALDQYYFSHRRLGMIIRTQCYSGKFFSDDVKAYVEIYPADDTIKVQIALDLISVWASERQLKLSISKCNILDIGHISHDTTHLCNWWICVTFTL